LRKEAEGFQEDRLFVGTLHSYLRTLAPDSQPDNRDARYWTELLPEEALNSLLGDNSASPFDELIVDEAQDLLRSNYLDVLDVSLRGGLAAGTWRLFGDFERQALYGVGAPEAEELLRDRASGTPRYRLRINCRNTPRIAARVRLLARLEPDYSRVLRADDGIEPDVRYITDQATGPDALIRALEDLRDEGFTGSDVVVLSPRSVDSAATRVTEQPWRDRLRPIGLCDGGHTPFATIHSFKGLEAPAVVITNIVDIRDSQAMALLYVAISRATDRLILILDEATKSAVLAYLASVGKTSLD
jgi:superfamily I DNA/RNA helicase